MIKVACVQFACGEEASSDKEQVLRNISKAKELAKEAADNGAKIILLSELFERKYFCQERNYDYYEMATYVEDNPAIKEFTAFCREEKVVMPISFYEKDGNVLYNSAVMIDADGTVLGTYRKHIFLMIIIIRRSFILHPGIQALRCLIRLMEESELESAGISGSRRLQGAWR